jgi:hypothetical protein
MAEDKAAAQDGSERPNSEPTLSGYRAYADAMRGGDAGKRAPGKDRSVEFMLAASPAKGLYHQLYLMEQRLRDHAGGDNYLARMKSFIAGVRDNQLPRLSEPRDRKSAVWHIKSEYEQWAEERKDMHARQRAGFGRNVESALQRRHENSLAGESADTASFFARQEVIERYARQHEALNMRLQQEITNHLDRSVERQWEHNRQNISRSEGAAFDEIVGRPRDSGRTRDKGPERDR